MAIPISVKKVRHFLGLASYFRKFVRDYAWIVEPLTRLTRKDVSWSWGEPQNTTFEKVKQILTTKPVLSIFNPHLRTELHTDACSIRVGVMLIQYEDDNRKVIAYFSKQTTNDQGHYHSYELETLAVVLALRHFSASDIIKQ